FLGALCATRRRVLKALMNAYGLSRKNRAGFFRVVADGDDVIEFLPGEFVHRLRPVAGNIDPDLTHCLNRLRPHGARLHAGAVDFEGLAAVVSQNAFRHLAPGGVSGAENQDTLFSRGGVHAGPLFLRPFLKSNWRNSACACPVFSTVPFFPAATHFVLPGPSPSPLPEDLRRMGLRTTRSAGWAPAGSSQVFAHARRVARIWAFSNWIFSKFSPGEYISR